MFLFFLCNKNSNDRKDISPSELCQEVQDLKFLVKSRIPETAPELLSFTEKYGEGFANLSVALQISLTVDLDHPVKDRSAN